MSIFVSGIIEMTPVGTKILCRIMKYVLTDAQPDERIAGWQT